MLRESLQKRHVTSSLGWTMGPATSGPAVPLKGGPSLLPPISQLLPSPSQRRRRWLGSWRAAKDRGLATTISSQCQQGQGTMPGLSKDTMENLSVNTTCHCQRDQCQSSVVYSKHKTELLLMFTAFKSLTYWHYTLEYPKQCHEHSVLATDITTPGSATLGCQTTKRSQTSSLFSMAHKACALC